MKKATLLSLLVVMCGGVAVAALVACGDANANAPSAASPSNASASSAPAEPPAKSGGGW